MPMFKTPPPISFRCSRLEAAELAEAAAAAGQTRSQLIREGALKLAALVRDTTTKP